MPEKITLCVVCGGQSAEHQVSLLSAKNVLDAINRERYDVVLVGITRQGVWKFFRTVEELLDHASDPSAVCLSEKGLDAFPMLTETGPALVVLGTREQFHFDVLFPVLHGTNGEDGAMQGLCRMLNCPCVGCDLASSAVSMDKDLTKRLLAGTGIRVARWVVVMRGEAYPDGQDLARKFGLPLFVKPARTGSSVGVCKVSSPDQLKAALDEAFKHDTKVLIEEGIHGREIECAVLGREPLFAAVPGEVVPKKDFYSYDAKYIDDDGAELLAPAPLSEKEIEQVQILAKRVFYTLECSGFARVDFFLEPGGTWVLNELNTIPGFTKISMYPKLMGLSGVAYSQLVDELIQLALQKPPVFF